MDLTPIAGAIVAAKPVNEFLRAVLGEPSREFGSVLSDWVRELKHKNLIAIVERAERRLREAGIPPKRVPLKIINPLLEAAALEEEPELQELWANLLANAADSRGKVEVCSQFVSILRELKPSDALFFQECVESGDGPAVGWAEVAMAAALKSGLANGETSASRERGELASEEAGRERERSIALTIDTLCRVGLLEKISQVEAIEPSQLSVLVEQLVKHGTVGKLKIDTELTPGVTELGRSFLAACRPLTERATGPRRR